MPEHNILAVGESAIAADFHHLARVNPRYSRRDYRVG